MRILKNKIEEKGFQCWMDIGKVGGGDALLAKIDAGIRDCKVSKSDFLVLNSSDCASDAVIFKTLHRQPALKITHVATLAIEGARRAISLIRKYIR